MGVTISPKVSGSGSSLPNHDSGTADVNIKNRIKMTLDFMDNNIMKHNKN